MKLWFKKKKKNKCEVKNFIPLYPNSDLNNEIYVDRLEEALKDDRILNIGVVGSYGSGKSSVLLGLLKKMPKKEKVMTISLATFEGEVTDKNGDGKKNVKDIEIGILQQIIYKVNSKKIPLSKIVRIKDDREWLFELVIVAILYFVYSGIFNETIKKFYDFLCNSFVTRIIPSNLIMPLLYIIGLVCIWKAVDIILKKFNISSLSFGGVNLSEESQKESILNKYIDEIIYILKKSKYKIIIFEDIDRFKNKDIFYKLRELNKIINDNDSIKKSGSVKFIYAVKNDILPNSEDRTKFFDYILPIIPIISNENAQLKFLEILEKIDFKGMVSEKMIQEVSYFVKDMRLVINICNEFKIYYEKIFVKLEAKEKDNFSVDKLFAIVAYKNINVADFEEMQYENGDIRKLIELKKDLREFDRIRIQSELDKLEKAWKKYKEGKEEEKRKIKEDIRRRCTNKTGYSSNFYTKYNHYKDDEDFIENAELEEVLEYGIFSGSSKNRLYTMEELYKENTWKEQNDKINFELKKYKEKYDEEIIKLTEGLEFDYNDQTLEMAYYEVELLNEYLKSLKDENINQEKIEELEKLIENKMLISFIRKGYIAEDYKYYINNLYLGNLSLEEHKFIVSLKKLEEKENFDVKIENFDVVDSRLDMHDYENHNVMNIDLFDCLLRKYDSNRNDKIIKSKVDAMVCHSKNSILGYMFQGTKESFFMTMMKKSKNINLFLQVITNKFYNIWDDIENTEELTIDEKEKLLNKFLSSDFVSDLCIGNIVDLHTKSVEKMKYIGLAAVKKVKKHKENLKFDDIEGFEEEVQSYIINNNMYKINKKNLYVVLNNGLKEWDKNENNYLTDLLKIENDVVNNRIKNDAEEILALENIKNISSEEFENFLNYIKDEEKCKQIIKEFEGQIEDISKINNKNLWEEILKNEKVIINLNNILVYKEQWQIDEKATELIDKNVNKIISDLKEKKKEEDNIKKLLLELIKFDKITDENIFKILKSCKWFKIDEYDFEEISEDRLIELINKNYILFTVENYQTVKKEQPNKIYDFCKNNIAEFIEKYDELDVENEIVEQLIFSEISDEHKLILLEKIKYDVRYKDVNDANTFIKIINRADSNYEKYFDFIRTEAFFDMANIEEEKIKCFVKYIDKLSKEEAHKLLKTFENSEYKKISNDIPGKPQKISEDDPIVELIKKLKGKDYIKVIFRNKGCYIQK